MAEKYRAVGRPAKYLSGACTFYPQSESRLDRELADLARLLIRAELEIAGRAGRVTEDRLAAGLGITRNRMRNLLAALGLYGEFDAAKRVQILHTIGQKCHGDKNAETIENITFHDGVA